MLVRIVVCSVAGIGALLGYPSVTAAQGTQKPAATGPVFRLPALMPPPMVQPKDILSAPERRSTKSGISSLSTAASMISSDQGS
jgi:hypothetical protein